MYKLSSGRGKSGRLLLTYPVIGKVFCQKRRWDFASGNSPGSPLQIYGLREKQASAGAAAPDTSMADKNGHPLEESDC